MRFRDGSVIVELVVEFLANVTTNTTGTEDIISSAMPIILQNLMDGNNTFTINGVNYPANIENILDSDNVTTCTCHI